MVRGGELKKEEREEEEKEVLEECGQIGLNKRRKGEEEKKKMYSKNVDKLVC